MTRVVLLRGVNVGGHRRFRPAKLAAELVARDLVANRAERPEIVRFVAVLSRASRSPSRSSPPCPARGRGPSPPTGSLGAGGPRSAVLSAGAPAMPGDLLR